MITFNFSPFPVLETERLILRQIKIEDAEPYYILRSDERVAKYSNRENPASVEIMREMIRTLDEGISSNEKIAWAVTKKEDGQFMGTLAFHKTDRKHHRAEIGYQLMFEHWNKGYISEALKAVIDYGFTVMKLHTIEARVNENNAVSIHLLKKNGFVKEGHFREDFFYNDEYFDTGVYSLVNRGK
jgi:ribosomal-protein-alanine N-acetyltransferase